MNLLGWTAIPCCAVLAACGTSFDPNIESRVTITRGVYGQAAAFDDEEPGGPPQYYPGLTVSRFASASDVKTPLASTQSDDRGFYQLEINDPTFTICLFFQDGSLSACASADTPQAPVRVDYGIGPVGHFYCTGVTSCPTGFVATVR
jgi:hypothetical protein